jgi:hypothetical protein
LTAEKTLESERASMDYSNLFVLIMLVAALIVVGVAWRERGRRF